MRTMMPARRSWILAAAALAVVVAGVWFFAEGPGARLISPPGSTIVELSGTGDLTSESFSVRKGWQIRWTSSGPAFALAIRGDRNLGTVVTVDEPSGAVTNPPLGGRYHLEISADGPWTVTVVQGD